MSLAVLADVPAREDHRRGVHLRSIHRLYPRPDPGPRPPDVNSAPADERDICEHIVSGSVEYYKLVYRSRQTIRN